MKRDACTVLTCTCRGTVPVGDAVAVLSGHPPAHELCRADLERFAIAAARPDPLLVACTQEAPTFQRAQADG